MRALLLLTYNLLRLALSPLWLAWWRIRRSAARYVEVTLRGPVEELPRPHSPLRRLLAGVGAELPSVAQLRAVCERIAEDPRAEGLVVRVESLVAGHATLGSLRRELAWLRACGKRVVCMLPSGADQRELYVASAADRILAMPHAGFSALGPLASRTYLAGLLGRMGVRMEVLAEGRYKTAAEPLVRETMSDPEREQLGALVEALHRDWTQAVGERPQLGRHGAEQLCDLGLFSAQRARALGVIDGSAYDDELPRELGLDSDEHPVSARRYLRRPARPPIWLPLRRRPVIAILRAVGVIGGRSARPSIELRSMAAAVRRLARAPHVAGVLLQIDSPGGSALVSEQLHREIERLAAQKPVVAWLGNVAASGGYYLACAARAIIAQPTTLTGSIGVVSLRPNAEALLAHLQVRREVVGRTPFSDLYSFARAPTEEEQALFRSETSRIYERFLEVVARGRSRSRDEIEALAEGRVWAGSDALDHGLVDALGGYREARAQLETLLGSGVAQLAHEPWVVSPPRRTVEIPAPLALPPGAATSASDELLELFGLLSTGEPALTYALGLPTLR